jgi:hypothetical protein
MAIPSDVPGLFAWYRADSYSLSDGTECSAAWTDKTSGGRSLTSSTGGTVKPKFRTSQIGGQPAIEFLASDQRYFVHTTFGWRASLGSHTIFVVFNSSALSTGGIVASQGGSEAEGVTHQDAGGTATLRTRYKDTAAKYAGIACPINEWHFACSSQTLDSQIALSLDGGAEVTTSVGTQDGTYPNAYVYLGLDGGAYWSGLLAEVVLYAGVLSPSYKQAIHDYLRARYFQVTPTQNEQIRDVLSRRLWNRRRPRGLVVVEAPLSVLDADIMTRVALQSRTAPAPDAEGWGAQVWSQRPFTVQRITDIDPARNRCKLHLLDRRPLDVLYWDTMRTDIPALTLDATRQNGVARITKGNVRTFVRDSRAFVTNPADASSVIEIQPGEHAYSPEGEYIEEARTNEITRSSFIDGTTGLTLAGTGTNGSAITTDADDLLFNPEIGALSLKFTAGSPHGAALSCAFPATASIAAGTNVRVSIDHKTDSGEGLYWRLTRGIDGWYWNAGSGAGVWQASSADNSMPTVATRAAASRYVSPYTIPVGAGDTTLTLTVLLQTGGTAGRISHLYHAQIEQGYAATSRIVTAAGVAATRAAVTNTIEVTTAAKIIDPALGTLWCEVVPHFDALDTSAYWVLFRWSDSGDDYLLVYYHNGSWSFRRKVAGVSYTSTLSQSVSPGAVYRIGFRWTGAAGELGLSPYSVTGFVNAVTAPTVVAPAASTFVSGKLIYVGHDSGNVNYWNGAIRDLRIFPYALHDDEIARLP